MQYETGNRHTEISNNNTSMMNRVALFPRKENEENKFA